MWKMLFWGTKNEEKCCCEENEEEISCYNIDYKNTLLELRFYIM